MARTDVSLPARQSNVETDANGAGGAGDLSVRSAPSSSSEGAETVRRVSFGDSTIVFFDALTPPMSPVVSPRAPPSAEQEDSEDSEEDVPIPMPRGRRPGEFSGLATSMGKTSGPLSLQVSTLWQRRNMGQRKSGSGVGTGDGSV